MDLLIKFLMSVGELRHGKALYMADGGIIYFQFGLFFLCIFANKAGKQKSVDQMH